MAKFRKKPIVIEAVQFTGRNDSECLAFCPEAVDPKDTKPSLEISTLEGVMRVDVGDWIIKGVAGEFYPCKPDIFEATYESTEHPTITQQQARIWCYERLKAAGLPIPPSLKKVIEGQDE